jgi:hypothetical protein
MKISTPFALALVAMLSSLTLSPAAKAADWFVNRAVELSEEESVEAQTKGVLRMHEMMKRIGYSCDRNEKRYLLATDAILSIRDKIALNDKRLDKVSTDIFDKFMACQFEVCGGTICEN